MKKRILPAFILASAILVPYLSSCKPATPPASQSTSSAGESSLGSSSAEGGDGEGSYGEDFVFDGILRIYYHRDDGNYATKRLWIWGSSFEGASLGEVEFANASAPDEFGVYADFDLAASPWSGIAHSYIGFIVKEAQTWSGQSIDIICPFNKFQNNIETNEDGRQLMTIYAVDNGDLSISTYASRALALGDRISSASFLDWKTIEVKGTGTQDGRSEEEIGKVESYSLYDFPESYYLLSSEEQSRAKNDYLVASGSPNSNSFTISLSEDAIPSHGYLVEASFASAPENLKSKSASFVSLYDDPKFNSEYTYSGHDLGVTRDGNGKLVFRLWAPTANRVQLFQYITGTPSNLSISGNQPSLNSHSTFEMRLGEHGVWTLTEDEIRSAGGIILEGDYYTYSVTNSEGTIETSDPYAKSTGINGERSMVVTEKTFEEERPEGYEESIASLPAISSLNDLFIYETHVRDVTADDTWISNEGNPRGTFLALAEHGTTYTEGGVTVSTGLDSILELGVNSIQLLPVFDGDNDERADEGSEFNGNYNWGYNPKNFNAVEGAYSTNPRDGKVKIGEFMTLIKTLADSGVRTIMDVVYNHTSSISGSSFTKVMPKYYFRTAEDGTYINGSGTGNVTASERPMVRNFIVDSVSFWASEYGIKGFRFDLMGCLDTETMKAVRNALNEIDPTIAVYGEGWDGSFGGPNGFENSDAIPANTNNVYSELWAGAEGLEDSAWGIGAFNDHGRDGLKGNTQWEGAAPDYGFISQGSEHLTAEKRNWVMGNFLGSNDGVGANPTQTINYASCHDNYTLYDQMNYCLGSGTTSVEDSQDARDATIAVTGAIVYSQGAAFIHGGEEIFRQKLMYRDDPYWDLVDQNAASNDAVDIDENTRLIRNSYTYGDAVNSYKYDRKVAFLDDYNRYKEVCSLRKEGMDGGYLGRGYDPETYAPVATSRWEDYQDSGAVRTVAAVNFNGLEGSADRYVCIAGRDPSDAMRALSFGSNRVKVVYSSTGYHKAGETIATSGFLGLGRYEFLILEKA